MGFKPLKEKHSIVEVVFGIAFSKPFGAPELEKFVAAHERWKEELPRASRSSALKLVLSDSIDSARELQLPSAGGVMFERIKPDGELDRRLRVDENFIYVNWLSYTTWTEVWKAAKKYLKDATDIVAATSSVSKILLQYVDVFEWEGDIKNYQLSQLIREDSSLVSRSVMNSGPLWHLHQGRFKRDGIPYPGRVLERINADGVERKKTEYLVKIDTYLELQLEQGLSTAVFFEDACEKIFDYLHDQNKTLLADLLNEEMKKRIGLDARA